MNRMNAVIDRLRDLPTDEAEALAPAIEALLDSSLSLDAAALAEIEARLDEPDQFKPHGEVMRRLQARIA